MTVLGADTHGDDRKLKTHGAPTASALVGAVTGGPRDPGPPSTARSSTAVPSTSPILWSPPGFVKDALHRRGYSARRATSEGATLYQSARNPLRLELAGHWDGSLPSSSTPKRHRVDETLLMPWVLGVYEVQTVAKPLNFPNDFGQKRR
jgi:hypothetical protein